MKETPDCQRISNSALGHELEPSECKILAAVMGVTHIKNDELLTSKGSKNSTLYLLADGKLEVVSTRDGEEKAVYTMVPGECSGTRAFVDRNTRRATLHAVGDCVVYTLEPDDFETLLESNPVIVYKVMRAIFRITHRNLMKMNRETEELSNYISKSGGRY